MVKSVPSAIYNGTKQNERNTKRARAKQGGTVRGWVGKQTNNHDVLFKKSTNVQMTSFLSFNSLEVLCENDTNKPLLKRKLLI